MGPADFLNPIVEALGITIGDVTKGDFVKWKAKP